jgi:hypothetical protein
MTPIVENFREMPSNNSAFFPELFLQNGQLQKIMMDT